MKTLHTALLLLGLPLAPLTFTTGCASATPQQLTYKSLASVQTASLAGLKLYGEAHARGEIDAATRAKVQKLYADYQAAFALARRQAASAMPRHQPAFVLARRQPAFAAIRSRFVLSFR